MCLRRPKDNNVPKLSTFYIVLLTLILGLGTDISIAARQKITDIQMGLYRPAHLPTKTLSKSQLRDRLALYQRGDSSALAKLILGRSYGDSLDYFYLAYISQSAGWTSTTRAYSRLAAIYYSSEIGKTVEEFYRMTDFPTGCGRIPLEYCPTASLGRSIIDLNASLDAADASEALAIAITVPETLPSSLEITDRNGRNLLHWYPDGRKIWVSRQETGDVRFMTLDAPLGSKQIAVPRFNSSEIVTTKTSDASWSVTTNNLESFSRIFSFQGAVSSVLEDIEELRNQRKNLEDSKSIPGVLDFYKQQRDNLYELRSRIEVWHSKNVEDQDSRFRLLSIIDGEMSDISKRKTTAVDKASSVERSLNEILEIDGYLRSAREDNRFLHVKCVDSKASCEEVWQALNYSEVMGDKLPYVLYVAPGRERKSQSVTEQQLIRSSYVIGSQQVRNPVYQNLQIEYQNAMLAVEAAQAAKSRADYNAAVNPGFLSGYAQGAALGALLRAQGRVEEITSALSQTSPLVVEERLSPYEFSENIVKALYRREYGLLLVHKKTNRAMTSKVVIEDSAVFTLAVGRSDTDKSGRRYSTEDEVARWLQRDRPVSASAIASTEWVKAAVVGANGNRDYEGVARKLVAIADGQPANSSQPALSKRDRSDYDPRLQSVVLVMAANSVGSGFFISKRNILTNAHVIGAETSVDVKFSDGRKFIARVIAVDERRDLALLRVEGDGRPSSFITDTAKIRPGVSVDVIGHPQGLEFSFSRGVVSAVRRNFKAAGGIDVIQTDSAINPGNSGGPLFLGNDVIGIVTFKRGLSEGLGFAVHRDEIQAFLREAFTQ
jgi:S1-C subfamily serine protease